MVDKVPMETTSPPRSAAAIGATSSGGRIRPRHMLTIAVLIGIGAILFLARGDLGPYVLGGLVAYLVMPLVGLIEGRLPAHGRFAGARRVVAVLLTLALLLLAILVLLALLLEPMIEQTTDLLEALPVYWEQLLAEYGTIGAWYEGNIPASTQAWIAENIRLIGREVIAASLALLGFLFNVTGGVISGLAAFVVIPLFMVYFLIDQPSLPARLRHQLPASWGEDAVATFHIADRILGNYTRGVIFEALIVGAITGTGYWLIGVEVALPLGVIAFAGEIIPILGPWIAFLISFPVVLVTQPELAIPAILLFGVIQALEGWIIAPKIQGESVDFRASTILVILAIGGALGDAFGMLISLPVAAVLRALIVYMYRRLSGMAPAQAHVGLLPGEPTPTSDPDITPVSPEQTGEAS